MASVVGRYTDSYEDVRPALPSLRTVDDHFTVDFHHNYNLNERWTKIRPLHLLT